MILSSGVSSVLSTHWSWFQDYVLWTDKMDQKNGIHVARLDRQEKVRGILHPDSGLSSQLITFDDHNQPDMKSRPVFLTYSFEIS